MGGDSHEVSQRDREGVLQASLRGLGRVLGIPMRGIGLLRGRLRLDLGGGRSRMFGGLLRGRYGLYNLVLSGNGMVLLSIETGCKNTVFTRRGAGGIAG